MGLLFGLAVFAVAYGAEALLFAAKGGLPGSLYMAMGAYFVNNTIVNILHVVSFTGADNLMFVRITIVQVLSFVVASCVPAEKAHYERRP